MFALFISSCKSEFLSQVIFLLSEGFLTTSFSTICFTSLTLLVQYSAQSLRYSDREMKGIKIGRKSVNFSLYAESMLLFFNDPKNAIKKVLE